MKLDSKEVGPFFSLSPWERVGVRDEVSAMRGFILIFSSPAPTSRGWGMW